jgi:phage baseplate assembly protein W
MGVVFGITLDTKSPQFALLTDDNAIIVQAVELLFSTPKDSYWTNPDYGFDLRAFVAKGLTPAALAGIPDDAAAALQADPRVARATVTATTTYTAAGQAVLSLSILVYPKGANAAPIALVATASRALVQLTTQGLSST